MLRLKDLKPNPKNPRIAAEHKLDMLKRSIETLGNLDGIIWNKRSKQLLGGHQRQKVLPEDAVIVIEETFNPPTAAGTTARGYIMAWGEKHTYQEKDWDETTEKLANIAANKGAGDWHEEYLADWMNELKNAGADLDLTMFDSDEVDKYLQIEASDGYDDITDTAPEFLVIVECANEGEQAALFEKLSAEGLTCKII